MYTPNYSANLSPSALTETYGYECLNPQNPSFFCKLSFDLSTAKCVHTPLHTNTPFLRFHAWVFVFALQNTGVDVSGLIFYLSGLITVAFTAALPQSVKDTEPLRKLSWKCSNQVEVWALTGSLPWFFSFLDVLIGDLMMYFCCIVTQFCLSFQLLDRWPHIWL